jgi:hypothetical protein
MPSKICRIPSSILASDGGPHPSHSSLVSGVAYDLLAGHLFLIFSAGRIVCDAEQVICRGADGIRTRDLLPAEQALFQTELQPRGLGVYQHQPVIQLA